MNRREFLKTFAAGSAIASFPFALKLAEVPKEIYQGSEAKDFVFDRTGSYGNMVIISEELEGKAFDESLSMIIDNAREVVPKGNKIQILFNPDPFGASSDPFNEYCSLAWKYSPVKFYKSPFHLGMITL